MKKRHRDITVNGKKYAWTVKNDVDGDGGNLVKIFYNKKIKFERLIPGNITLTPKYISKAIGGLWYTLLQEKASYFIRKFYYEEYPTRLNHLLELMKINKSFAVTEVREKLKVENSKENNLEIEKVINDIIIEEDDDFDDDYYEQFEDL